MLYFIMLYESVSIYLKPVPCLECAFGQAAKSLESKFPRHGSFGRILYILFGPSRDIVEIIHTKNYIDCFPPCAL